MKISNYDTKSPTQGRSLCNFLDEDFRLLISGQSGCGKTNTVMHILRKPLVYYDKIHFFTPNQHQDKMLTSKSDETHFEKVGYEVLELHSPRKSWTHQNTQATTEKSLFLMTLLMHLIEFNQNCKPLDRWQASRNFSDLSFAILLRCSAEDQVKLFAHDSLSPSDKKTCGSDCKRKLDPTKSVQQAGTI